MFGRVIDIRAFEHEGKPYALVIVPDGDCRPEQFDCYTPEDIHAWYQDHWRYVGVIVIGEDGRDSALWGVHYGKAPGWEYTTHSILTEEYESVDGVPHTLPQSLARQLA